MLFEPVYIQVSAPMYQRVLFAGCWRCDMLPKNYSYGVLSSNYKLAAGHSQVCSYLCHS